MVNSFINGIVNKTKYTEKPNQSAPVGTSKNTSITLIKAKLVCLIKSHPDGIPLGRVIELYEKKYHKRLYLEQYRCKTIVEFLDNFKDVVDIHIQKNKSKVVLKGKCTDKEDIPINADKEQERINAAVFSDVRAMKEKNMNKHSEEYVIFKAIMETNGGMCMIESLPHQYEIHTKHKLDLKEVGCNSLLELVSSLGDDFGVRVLNNGQSILVLKGDPILEDKLKAMDLQDALSNSLKVKFTDETKARVTKLLTDFYPDGLTEDEIHGAYKGLFGSALEDFDPITYGSVSIREMLEDEITSVKIINRNNNTYYVTPDTYESMSESIVFGDEGEELCHKKLDEGLPLDVIKKHEKFQPYMLSNLVKVGQAIDVVGGDCYSAHRFYIQLHAKEHSDALDDMVSDMCTFYGSEMKKRYAVPDDCFLVRYPMAFYYPKDDCFYRGIINSWEDLENMKVFLVDYGTQYCTTKDNVYLLHREFFKLPPQAFKAQLHGIKPPDGRNYFLSSHSQHFLKMMVDQIFTVLIHRIENNSLIVTALNVPQVFLDSGGLDDSVRTEQNTININKDLVAKGFAVYTDESDYQNELTKLNKRKKAPKKKKKGSANEIAAAVKCDATVVAKAELVKSSNDTTEVEETKSTVSKQAASKGDESTLSTINDSLTSLKISNEGSLNSHFQDIAKKCKNYSAMMSNSAGSCQKSTEINTSTFSDMSSNCRISQYANNTEQLTASSIKMSKSNSIHRDSSLERVNSNLSLSSLSKMSSNAAEFIPLSDDFNSCTGMGDECKYSPRTQSRTSMVDTDDVNLLDTSDLKNKLFMCLQKEKIPLPNFSNGENIPIRCEFRKFTLSANCEIRAIRDKNEWYMVLNELQYIILNEEALKTVIEVLENPEMNKTEISLFTNPDMFMLLARHGADYLFTRDGKIITKLQIIHFNVVLPIMEQIHPRNQEVLDGLKKAEDQLTSSLNRQSQKTDFIVESFKLRDCLLEDSQSLANSLVSGNLNVESRSATTCARPNSTLPKMLDDFCEQSRWETRSAICGSNSPFRPFEVARLQPGNSFAPTPLPFPAAYPVVRHPPGFNNSYPHQFPSMLYQQHSLRFPYLDPYMRNSTTGHMPYDITYPPGYY